MSTSIINPEWKVNTPGLLREIANNSGQGILRIPIVIFASLLYKVGERAAQLNDPQLNALMLRLSIYDVADPESKEFDPERVNSIIAESE